MTEVVKGATEVILQRLLGGVWKPSFFTMCFPFLSPCPALLSVICLFACQENMCLCVCVCMCLCVSMCMCLCACVCVRVHVYARVSVSLYVHVFVSVCAHVSLCVCVCACVCTCVRVCVCLCVCVPVCARVSVSLCVYLCVRTPLQWRNNESWEQMLSFCLLSISLTLFCFLTCGYIWKGLLVHRALFKNQPCLLVMLEQTACLGTHTRRGASEHAQLVLSTLGGPGQHWDPRVHSTQAAVRPRAAKLSTH